MKLRVYKAIDNELVFFGVRGGYRRWFLIGAGAAVCIGVFVAKAVSSVLGVLLLIALGAGVYLAIVLMQDTYDYRTLSKALNRRRFPVHVFLRSPFPDLWR